MTPECLWHLTGEPWAPRRCRHRILVEAGPYYVAAANCRSIPDPGEDWKGKAFKVEQVQKRTVDTGGKWTTVRPALPPKVPRPARPEPWSSASIPPGFFESIRFALVAGDAAVLGLAHPFSAKDVRAAFRRKAREAHPDTGGSADAFVSLKASRDRLLEVLGSRA